METPKHFLLVQLTEAHVDQNKGQLTSRTSPSGSMLNMHAAKSSFAVTGIVILIVSVITWSLINKVEDTVIARDIKYEEADIYRGAAIWLVCASSAGIFYQIVMLTVHYLYLNTLNALIEKHFKSHLLLDGTLCVAFAICLFAGGVASATFSAADHQLAPDICVTTFHALNDQDKAVCNDILKIKILEGVSASISFISVLTFASIFIFMLGSYPKKNKINIISSSNQSTAPSQSQDMLPHPPNPPAYPSTDPPSYESVTAQPYAPATV